MATDICVKCVLPAAYPNIEFDAGGLCNFCRRQEQDREGAQVERQRRLIEETIEDHRGGREYDALCCYSGGKDSTYMLKTMKEIYGLRPLSFTLDNGFITEPVKRNINRVVDALGVDHIYYRPSQPFLTKLFRLSVVDGLHGETAGYQTRISDICLSCITLVNTHAAKIALQRRIPMVFAGFTAGQIPKAVIKNGYLMLRETFARQKERFEGMLGGDASHYFDLPEAEFDIYQIAPNMVIDKTEREILDAITPMGWIPPENLDGCTSNCALNGFANLSHKAKFGFHPYAAELSTLIRKGLMGREEALEKLERMGAEGNVRLAMTRLNISQRELDAL